MDKEALGLLQVKERLDAEKSQPTATEDSQAPAPRVEAQEKETMDVSFDMLLNGPDPAPEDGLEMPTDMPALQYLNPSELGMQGQPAPLGMNNQGSEFSYPGNSFPPMAGVPVSTQEQPAPLAGNPYTLMADPSMSNWLDFDLGAPGSEQVPPTFPAGAQQDGETTSPRLFTLSGAPSQEWQMSPTGLGSLAPNMGIDPALFAPLWAPQSGREVPQEDIDAHQQRRLEAFIAGQEAAQAEPASPPAKASQPQEEGDALAGSTLEEPAPSCDETIVVGGRTAKPPREPRSGTPCQNPAQQPPTAPIRPKMFKMSRPGPKTVKWPPAAPVRSKDSDSADGPIDEAPAKMSLGHSSKPTDCQPPTSIPHPFAFFRTAPYMEPPSATSTAPRAEPAPEQEPDKSCGSKRKSKSTGPEGEEAVSGQKKPRKEPKTKTGPKKPRGPKWEGLTTELRFLAGMYGPGGIIGAYGSVPPGPVPGAPPGLPLWLPGGGIGPSGGGGGSSSQLPGPLNSDLNPGQPTGPGCLPPDQV